MSILALDTSTRATSVALCEAGRGSAREARDDPEPGARPGHARCLLALAARLLEEADLSWAAVERIAVGRGPGSFTGLRIGIASARALGVSLGVPLVGVSTLESLALGAATEDEADIVLAVLDARRGEVFAAAWDLERSAERGLGERRLESSVLAPEALAEWVAARGEAVLAVGDGAVEFAPGLARAGAAIPSEGSALHRVSAANHCRLAHRTAEDGGAVLPDYLRAPDAELTRRARTQDVT